MCEAMDKISENRANEAVLAVSYKFAKALWNDGVHELERISRLAELSLEQIKKVIGMQIAHEVDFNISVGFMVEKISLYTEEQLRELAFTKEELAQLEKARQMPITFDEECLPTTPEKALKFKRVNPSGRFEEET